MQLDERNFLLSWTQSLKILRLNDEQIYASLYKKISQAKPNALSNLQLTLKSLKSLKDDLGDQTA